MPFLPPIFQNGSPILTPRRGSGLDREVRNNLDVFFLARLMNLPVFGVVFLAWKKSTIACIYIYNKPQRKSTQNSNKLITVSLFGDTIYILEGSAIG